MGFQEQVSGAGAGEWCRDMWFQEHVKGAEAQEQESVAGVQEQGTQMKGALEQ